MAEVTPWQTEGPVRFGILVAQGMFDIYGLETEYLAQILGERVPMEIASQSRRYGVGGRMEDLECRRDGGGGRERLGVRRR